MKEIFAVLASVFQTEFSQGRNILGWSLTGSIWFLTNIENINNILTLLLTFASLVWVTIKIVLAIKNGRREK